MKIAINSIISRPVSPVTFGGTEGFTYILVEELKRRNYDVHLYAASDSQTSAILHSVNDSVTAREKRMGESLSQPYYLLLAQNLTLDSSRYDIIHNNYFHYYFFSAFTPFLSCPVVHTIHSAFFQDKNWQEILKSFHLEKNEHFVFVSEYARQLAGFKEQSSVIYHGIDLENFPYNENASNAFLWLGRMVPEKGAAQAVQAAKQSGISLMLNTARDAKIDLEYFTKEVEPYLSDKIRLERKDTLEEKVKLYQQAKAMLFPITWEEPFGLVMLEAMSCGTPIIGYARGSVPEIIKDGVTGFIVNPSEEKRGNYIIQKTGIEGLKEAIERINNLSAEEYHLMRKNSRKHVEDNFAVGRMIKEYEQLYKRLIAQEHEKHEY
ncbi:MAG TPA: glycosyltransferase family 4 protein [Methylomirabilota bacterium]|nr:glycosyltransferase family 4 protein [Methylomirabilota bacterium]